MPPTGAGTDVLDVLPRARLAAHPSLAAYAHALGIFDAATDGRFRAPDAWPPVSAWEHAATAARLRNAQGLPLRFVTQVRRRRRRGPVDVGTLYDERIFTRGEVPSRERNLHDFLNLLQWLAFPRAKAAVNARQRAALQRWVPVGATSLPGARTREQDALTMLDEGGLLVLVSATVVAEASGAMASGDADAIAALAHRNLAVPLAFGHALAEHLCGSGVVVRALSVLLVVEALAPKLDERVRQADEALAALLSGEGHAPWP
jgi:hypothetical protein